MRRAVAHLKSLSVARQFVLVGALLSLIAIFMPWHAVGVATLGTEQSYSGFGDQNFIIGFLTLIFSTAALFIVILPLLGARPPQMHWRESTLLLFFGGETALLVLVLTVMHSTALTRAVNYDLRYGIHLAFIGAALVFLGGYLLRLEEGKSSVGHHELLTRMPRRHSVDAVANHGHQTVPTDKSIDSAADDSRMRLDI